MFFSACLPAIAAVNQYRYKTMAKSQQSYELWHAVATRNLSKVHALLDIGVSPNFNIDPMWRVKVQNGEKYLPGPVWVRLPLIHLAAMLADNDQSKSILNVLINALINEGADLSIIHEPLHLEKSGSILHNVAHFHADYFAFNMLISGGANVHAKNSRGVSFVSALLSANSRDERVTSKRTATLQNKVSTLYSLVSRNVELNADDRRNILKLIASKPIREVDRLLLSLCMDKNIELIAKHEGNILHFLAEKFHPENYDEKNFLDSMYIKYYDKVSKPDARGLTPLHVACQSGNLYCVNKFLENQEALGLRDQMGAIALHYAAGADNLECLNKVITCAKDLDIPDFKGRTPLMYAIRAGKVINAAALLTNGADLTLKDLDDKSIADYARLAPKETREAALHYVAETALSKQAKRNVLQLT